MASTTNLKMVKPVSEHDANKIVTLNTESDDLDLAVAGMVTISVAGTGSTTLTRAQAINKVFKFTGLLTGARTIVLPVSLGSGRKFVAWNATTGAFSLTIKTDTGGSTGAIVTQGTKPVLFHDGTDVIAVSSAGAGTGDALVANPLSQFAATTSAQLAGVLTDETGSGGGFVRATSPTIVTPTIADFTNSTHNHSNAAGGGQLSATNAFSSGTVPTARLGSGTANSTTFLRGDQSWQTVSGTGDVTAAANFGTDNRALRSDGTLKGSQSSEVDISDAGNISTPGSLTTGSAGGVSADLALSGSSSGTAHITAPAAAGTGTFNLPVTTGGTFSLGYLNIPQNSQSAAYTLVLEDQGKHILHPNADNNARTFTIPANSSVAFPMGTTLTFINEINTVTIAITTDTLVLAGPGTTGSRTLAANGMATAVKITSTKWMINGSGLT